MPKTSIINSHNLSPHVSSVWVRKWLFRLCSPTAPVSMEWAPFGDSQGSWRWQPAGEWLSSWAEASHGTRGSLMFPSYVPWGWLFLGFLQREAGFLGAHGRNVRSSKVFTTGPFAQVVSGVLSSSPALSPSGSSFPARMCPLEEVKVSHFQVVSYLKQQSGMLDGLLSSNFIILPSSVWISLLAVEGKSPPEKLFQPSLFS